MIRFSPLALAATIGLTSSAALLGVETARNLDAPQLTGAAEAAERAGPPPVAKAPASPVVKTPDEAGYREFAARNLFSITRAPIAEDAPAVTAPAPPAPEDPPFSLIGSAMSRDMSQGTGPETGAVIIAPGRGRGSVRLAVGEVHDGWRLTRLTPRSATFSKAGRSVTLRLDFRQGARD